MQHKFVERYIVEKGASACLCNFNEIQFQFLITFYMYVKFV